MTRTTRATRKRATRKRTTRKTSGGFIPSVMEGFCAATSKYITPLTLLLLHRMMASPTKKQKKQKKQKQQK